MEGRMTVFSDIVREVADKEIESPNYVGEALRSWAFVGGYGCYSSFTLNDGFSIRPITQAIAERMLGRPFQPQVQSGFCGDWCDDEIIQRGTYAVHSNGAEIAWFWDGDGTLWFRVPGGLEVVNHDCKHCDEWEFCPPPNDGP